MPYDVRRSGSQYEVVGPEGRVMGTHSTRAEAVDQQRALYANEPDASKAEQPIKNNWAGMFFPRRD
mgnify:CR=1 FL=1